MGSHRWHMDESEMMSLIPKHIWDLIRKAYPTGDLEEGAKSHLVRREFDSSSLVARIVSQIEHDCNTSAYRDPGGYYERSHRISYTTSKRDVPLWKRSPLWADQFEYVKDRGGVVYDGQVRVSQLGPYAALSWHETRIVDETVTPSLQNRSPPTAECAGLQRCVEAILVANGVEILPWDLLDLTVPGMEGKPFGEPVERLTVYNCLFSSI